MGSPAEAIHTTNERIYLPMMWPHLELLIRVAHQLTT
jgi:hypothetical protein